MTALFVLVFLGVMLPTRLIDPGVEDFEGRDRRMAARAFFHVATYYGESFVNYDDYIGPPLVLGWRTGSAKECPDPSPGKTIEKDSYRAYGGANAGIGAYSLFGIPRGEVEVTCGGRRQWQSYF